jgi:ankyrin repeat protein
VVLPVRNIYASVAIAGLEMNRLLLCVSVLVLCFISPSLLQAQEKPNCLAPSNEPLIQAVRDGDRAKASAMISSGTNLNIVDQCGANPLWEAIRLGDTDFFLELLKAGADPKFPDGGAEALAGAVFTGNLKIAQELLRRGVAANAANSEGMTALMNAPHNLSDGKMVSLLLHAGADPNAHDKDGFNALLASAMTGDVSAAAELLKAGADPTFKSKRGKTPESEACDRGERGHVQVCALVREALRNPVSHPTRQ